MSRVTYLRCRNHIILLIDTAEIVSINPLIPQDWGIFLKPGGTPSPPAGSILHLFFNGLPIVIARHRVPKQS